MSKLNSKRRGAVLIPAVICVMTVAALSTAYLQLSMDKSREARGAVEQKKAFYVAEAGLAEAFYGIAQGKSGSVAGPDQPAGFGGGVFWVESENLGAGKVALRSTGLVGSGRASLSITLQRDADALGKLGLFSEQELLIRSGALLDAYDSALGTYASQAASSESGECTSSNGSITLEGTPGAQIRGDARPGPQASVMRSRTAQVTGSMAPASELRTLAELEIPQPTQVSDYDHNHTGAAFLSSGDYGFGQWTVRGGGTLTVRGPAQIIVDDLSVESHSRLVFDTSGGSITVWVRNQITTGAGSELSSSAGATDRFSLMVGGSAVSLNGGGVIHGLVYAPLAEFSWPSGMELYGSVAARRLTIQSNARLHYDRALGRAPEASSGIPELVCWRVMELPDVPLVTMKFDPLTVLRLNSVEPLKAELAHETALPAAGADEAAEDSKSDSSDTGDEKAKKKASKGKGASSKKKEWELPRSGGF
jgi:Tfp pilus assembly protein PilX